MFNAGDKVRPVEFAITFGAGEIVHMISPTIALVKWEHIEGQYPHHISFLVPAREGNSQCNSESRLVLNKEEDPSNMTTSVSRVNTTPVGPVTTVKRSSLKMFDLYRHKLGGKVYMHTGVRTRPPSGSGDVVSVNGFVVHDGRPKSIGLTPSGKDIIAYQGVVVRGAVSPGEDGTVVTFDGDKDVIFLGTAGITLPAGV